MFVCAKALVEEKPVTYLTVWCVFVCVFVCVCMCCCCCLVLVVLTFAAGSVECLWIVFYTVCMVPCGRYTDNSLCMHTTRERELCQCMSVCVCMLFCIVYDGVQIADRSLTMSVHGTVGSVCVWLCIVAVTSAYFGVTCFS
eukprot:GHVQ01008806.1.p1 GENE.GHVQ01008806.1~~GHVQ01008806.1.p1  ORF type:complete len:141 (-),score=23.46 GHVQ01008806.1:183-605(-)